MNKTLNTFSKGLFYVSAAAFVLNIIGALFFWNELSGTNSYRFIGFLYIGGLTAVIFFFSTILVIVTRPKPEQQPKNSYGLIALGFILAFIIGIIILNIT